MHWHLWVRALSKAKRRNLRMCTNSDLNHKTVILDVFTSSLSTLNLNYKEVSIDCILSNIMISFLSFPTNTWLFNLVNLKAAIIYWASRSHRLIVQYVNSLNLLIFFVSSSSLLFLFPAEQYSHAMLLSFEVYRFVFLLILLWATTIPGRLVSFTEAILQSKAAKVAGSGIIYFHCITLVDDGDQHAPSMVFSHTYSLFHSSPVHLKYSVGFSICHHWQKRFNNQLCLLMASTLFLHYLQTDLQLLFGHMRLLRDYLLFPDITVLIPKNYCAITALGLSSAQGANTTSPYKQS